MQVCFTADPALVKAIDEIAKNIRRSRSDTINTILWLAIKDKNLVLFLRWSSASGGTSP
jgi:predicted transcriptional regulator